MQILMSVCGLPLMTQLPRLSALIAKGETENAWVLFIKRHLIGLAAMIISVLILWKFGGVLLNMVGSKSQLLDSAPLLFMGFIYILEFNHGYCAVFIMCRNEVPFVWAASLSGIAICLGGAFFSETHGVWGLLGTVFVVQLAWNNWWCPLLALKMRYHK